MQSCYGSTGLKCHRSQAPAQGTPSTVKYLFRVPERLFAAGRVNAPDAWLSHAMSKSHHFGPFYDDARYKLTPLDQDHLDTLRCAANLANGPRALAMWYSTTGLLPRPGQTSQGIEKG
jgi:hypothetical protein